MKNQKHTLKPGDIVGIIGKTGSGKTTLVKNLALPGILKYKHVASHNPALNPDISGITTLWIDIRRGKGCMQPLRGIKDSLIIIDSIRLLLSQKKV